MRRRAATSILCSVMVSWITVGSAFALKDPPPRQLPPAHVQTDQEIETAVVKGILANPEVFAAGIRVRVVNRVVTLTGFVRTRASKKMAGKVARAVPGVREVRNELSVR